MVSAKSLWGNVLLGGELQVDKKKLQFQNFESAHFMKSGSMPLSFGLLCFSPTVQIGNIEALN